MRTPTLGPRPAGPQTSQSAQTSQSSQSSQSALSSKGTALVGLLQELTKLHAVLLRKSDALAAPAHLNGARVQVLARVERTPSPVAHIARDLSLTRQSIQQTADALVDKGYGEYRDNPHHQRAKLLAVTTKGKKALLAIDEAQTAWANGIAGDLTLKELDAAVATLRAVHASLLDDL